MSTRFRMSSARCATGYLRRTEPRHRPQPLESATRYTSKHNYAFRSPTRQLTQEQRLCIDALLDELLDMHEWARMAELRSRRGEDAAVLAEVESLLLAAHASDGFLDAN